MTRVVITVCNDPLNSAHEQLDFPRLGSGLNVRFATFAAISWCQFSGHNMVA